MMIIIIVRIIITIIIIIIIIIIFVTKCQLLAQTKTVLNFSTIQMMSMMMISVKRETCKVNKFD